MTEMTKKTVNWNGHELTQEQYESIKDSFYIVPQVDHANEILQQSFRMIRSTINFIDSLLTEQDYYVDASFLDCKQKATEFFSNPVIAAAYDNDMVVISQFLELCCSINCRDKQIIVMNALTICMGGLMLLSENLMH